MAIKAIQTQSVAEESDQPHHDLDSLHFWSVNFVGISGCAKVPRNSHVLMAVDLVEAGESSGKYVRTRGDGRSEP